MRWMNTWAGGLLAAALIQGGCARPAAPDAYGNVEATEVVVGAEAAGRLVSYTVADGAAVSAGAVVGAIDAAQLGFEREQLAAQRTAAASRGSEVRQQTIAAQVAGAEAQVSQAGERIRKTEIRNPIDGTVLTTYAKAGEVVQAGQPLYRVANLTSMEVRAYVTEPQLSSIRLGQDVRVSIDSAAGARQAVPGTITWISARAEFTPTPIQTREERVDMVYAIKIRVANDAGVLKIGMPVDVQFVPVQAAR